MSINLFRKLVLAKDEDGERREFEICTGMSADQFRAMVGRIEKAQQQKVRSNPERKVGRPCKDPPDPIANRLLMHCLHHRLHLTQVLIKDLYGFTNRSLVSRRIKEAQAFIEKNATRTDKRAMGKVYDTGGSIAKPKEFRRRHDKLKIVIKHIEVLKLDGGKSLPKLKAIDTSPLQAKILKQFVEKPGNTLLGRRAQIIRFAIEGYSNPQIVDLVNKSFKTIKKCRDRWLEYLEVLECVEGYYKDEMDFAIKLILLPALHKKVTAKDATVLESAMSVLSDIYNEGQVD